MVLMMGHKICFYGEIWLIIPVTPSYLEHCYYTVWHSLHTFTSLFFTKTSASVLRSESASLIKFSGVRCAVRNLLDTILEMVLFPEAGGPIITIWGTVRENKAIHKKKNVCLLCP